MEGVSPREHDEAACLSESPVPPFRKTSATISIRCGIDAPRSAYRFKIATSARRRAARYWRKRAGGMTLPSPTVSPNIKIGILKSLNATIS